MVGDDTPVIEAVLACDVERNQLLKEEAEILAKLHKVRGKGMVWCGVEVINSLRSGTLPEGGTCGTFSSN